MTVQTHYPGYDVRDSIKEWDPITTDLILKRMGPYPPLKFLKDKEVPLLRTIAQHLVYDNRDNIFNWVIHYIDERLNNKMGEYQRRPNTPPEDILIRKGLTAINNLSQKLYNKNFISTSVKKQFEMLSLLQLKKAPNIPDWSTVPQKQLFDKLLILTVSAYYSHPEVWSEIGYGGPAYPRGYYRIEFGLRDPWEAERKKETD